MKPTLLSLLFPMLLLFAFGGNEQPDPALQQAATTTVDQEKPERLKSLMVKKEQLSRFQKNAKVDHFTLSEKGVLRPNQGYALIRLGNGAVFCPEIMVGEIYRLNLDKYPSLDNVQGPAIVRCICAESYREKCSTIEFPRSKPGEGAKYCMGRCDCRAIIHYLELPTYFDRWESLRGKWGDF